LYPDIAVAIMIFDPQTKLNCTAFNKTWKVFLEGDMKIEEEI
jgi:hypothetical protein